ncbi:MAG: hypothetical protein HC850_03825 [Rhodomicrobium sp.]|nr:hypothetical protein [Rhodomicrobium sp.]
MIGRLEAAYRSAARAVSGNELRADREIAATAAAAMATYVGLTIMAKAGAAAGTLEEVVRAALDRL